jgi:hypothetical protein
MEYFLSKSQLLKCDVVLLRTMPVCHNVIYWGDGKIASETRTCSILLALSSRVGRRRIIQKGFA